MCCPESLTKMVERLFVARQLCVLLVAQFRSAERTLFEGLKSKRIILSRPVAYMALSHSLKPLSVSETRGFFKIWLPLPLWRCSGISWLRPTWKLLLALHYKPRGPKRDWKSETFTLTNHRRVSLKSFLITAARRSVHFFRLPLGLPGKSRACHHLPAGIRWWPRWFYLRIFYKNFLLASCSVENSTGESHKGVSLKKFPELSSQCLQLGNLKFRFWDTDSDWDLPGRTSKVALSDAFLTFRLSMARFRRN